MIQIERIVNDLKKNKAIKAIFLFGSYARGTQKPISDIDICVVTDSKISDRTKGIILSHSSQIDNISLFWDMPPAVRYSVIKNNKKLYVQDKAYLHDAILSTMHEHFDFKYFIDKRINRYNHEQIQSNETFV